MLVFKVAVKPLRINRISPGLSGLGCLEVDYITSHTVFVSLKELSRGLLAVVKYALLALLQTPPPPPHTLGDRRPVGPKEQTETGLYNIDFTECDSGL